MCPYASREDRNAARRRRYKERLREDPEFALNEYLRKHAYWHSEEGKEVTRERVKRYYHEHPEYRERVLELQRGYHLKRKAKRAAEKRKKKPAAKKKAAKK